MEPHLVSVICLCFNHARLVGEAIRSVLNQTHRSIQLIVVDDASTDGSPEVIATMAQNDPRLKVIQLTTNVGNCRAFNIGLKQARGAYLIDLAADDVLLPHRVEEGVAALVQYGSTYGVQFSDALLIDGAGNPLGQHSDRFPHHTIPTGDIYKDVIGRYFICSPTMMVRREIFDLLGGYDEALDYEDFDFWIRSSRLTKYIYLPRPLVKRRLVPGSMRSEQFTFRSSQMQSTFQVCKKIKQLNRDSSEDEALAHRLVYEMKVALKFINPALCYQYLKLWRQVKNAKPGNRDC